MARIEALAAADAALHGPIGVDSMVDLPLPPDVAPTHVGRPPEFAGRYPVLVDHFAVADDGDVFVLDDSAGELVRQPQGDVASATVLARVGQSGARVEQLFDLAVDADSVYFVSTLRSFDGSEAVYAVRQVPRSGGVATVIHRADVRGGVVDAIALDDGGLWWHRNTEGDGPQPGAIASGGTLAFRARDGGEVVERLRGVGGYYAWTLAGDDVIAFLQRESSGAGALVRVPKRGGEATTLVETPDAIGAVVAVAAGLAYTLRTDDPDRGGLWVIDAGAGAPRQIGSYGGFPTSLAADGDEVFTCELPEGETTAPTQTVHATPWRGGASRSVRAGVPRGAVWNVVRGRLYWGGPSGVESMPVR